MKKIILASRSPRRKELLKLITEDFEAIASGEEEIIDSAKPPEEIVESLALQKAESVFKKHGGIVIGSDTIVVSGEYGVYGIPETEKQAREMLKSLSGKTHAVFTGTAVVSDTGKSVFHEKTEVTFYDLSDDEIERYIATGEPMDKAGAYGIQGYGAKLIKKINGDYFSVVGLSVARLSREIENFLKI